MWAGIKFVLMEFCLFSLPIRIKDLVVDTNLQPYGLSFHGASPPSARVKLMSYKSSTKRSPLPVGQ